MRPHHVCFRAPRWVRRRRHGVGTAGSLMALHGKQLVFTGTLELKRAEAKAKAEAAGASVASSVVLVTIVPSTSTRCGSQFMEGLSRVIGPEQCFADEKPVNARLLELLKTMGEAKTL